MSLILPQLWSPYVATGGSYTENTVTLTSGDYLTGTALPTDAKACLFFFSGTMSSSVSSRAALLNWDGFSANSGFYADTNATAGKWGVRGQIADDNTGTMSVAEQSVDDDTRCHILVSAYIESNNLLAKAWLYNTGVGSWSSILDSTDATADTASLIFTPDNARIFNDSGAVGTNHPFIGDVNRVAFWTKTTTGHIADVDSLTERNWFTNGNNTVDPSTSQTNCAGANTTLQIDLNGPTADWNATTGPGGGAEHDGTMTLTKTGTFT